MPESYRKPWDFFISYAREDRESAAIPLSNELNDRGFSVWLDHEVLVDGQKLEEQIEKGLTQCHVGIVILSPDFIRKDWPLRELDVLLGIETLENMLRVVPVLFNLKAAQIHDTAPTLCQRATIDIAAGFDTVCDKVLELVMAAADRDRQSLLGPLGIPDLPRFRAVGIVKCPSSSCTWRLPAGFEDLDLDRDPGPEFTLKQVDARWCIVCVSCGSAVGWLTLDEAKKVVSMIRVNGMWAPSRDAKGVL